MTISTLLRRTFGALIGLRAPTEGGPSAEARENRNKTVARIAYGQAYCDGQVHPLEREALARVVWEVYPWVDQTDILAHFDQLSREYHARPHHWVLDEKRIAEIPSLLFESDIAALPDMMERIARAHEGVVPAERALITQITSALHKRARPAGQASA